MNKADIGLVAYLIFLKAINDNTNAIGKANIDIFTTSSVASTIESTDFRYSSNVITPADNASFCVNISNS